MELKTISAYIKSHQNSIKTLLGDISNLKQIGQGGNGLVYEGKLYEKTVAIKFLVSDNNQKLTRFKAEYFNINTLQPNENIVKYLNFEELHIDEEIVPMIIMNKYDYSLKKYRENLSSPSWENFVSLFTFLMNSIEFIHSNGIIHRDLKPENILVLEEDTTFALADFGIASYSDQYLLKAITKAGERIGNYEFSAPEQATKDVLPCKTMDIYALGQICQWFIFGNTHKGTNRELFTSIFENKSASLFDEIIDICISNNSSSRFQSIQDIRSFINEYNDKISNQKIDPFDEMYIFNHALRSSFPEAIDKPFYSANMNRIKILIDNINSQKFKSDLWFNTGSSNNSIFKLNLLPELILSDQNNSNLRDDIILINFNEFKLKGVWVYHSSNVYDDFLIFDVDGLEGIEIQGNILHSYAIANGNKIITSDCAESGYFIENDVPVKIKDCEYRYRDSIEGVFLRRYYFVAPQWNNFILPDNDSQVHQIQSSELTPKILDELRLKIYYNRHPKVAACL